MNIYQLPLGIYIGHTPWRRYDFYVEVHYEGTDIQNESIRRVIAERGKVVYATAFKAGAILVDNGNIKSIGNVISKWNL